MLSRLRSVRGRLTLWHAGALGVTLLVLFAFGHRAAERRLLARVDERLAADSDAVASVLRQERTEGESLDEAAQSVVREALTAQQAVALLDADGRVRAERPLADGVRPGPLAVQPAPGGLRFATHRLGPGRVRAVTRDVTEGDDAYRVVVVESLADVDRELLTLRDAALAILPLAVGLALLAGWVLAGRALRPVLAMSRDVRALGAADLERRLDVPNPDDELGHLARTFNDLLARLQSAFERQRRFMADASHELRTPLSIVRTAASMTMHRDGRSEAEYRDALRVVEDEAGRASRLVDDLLVLARADAGEYPVRRRAIDLGEAVRDCVLMSRVLAQARGITIGGPGALPAAEAPYDGDPDLLKRMLLNLLANAIAHTPAGGAVEVACERRPDGYRITVRDAGPGIPAADRERVFDRFYRADGGERTGAGLGLAIGRWIAEAHGGRLTLAETDGAGALFVAELPHA